MDFISVMKSRNEKSEKIVLPPISSFLPDELAGQVIQMPFIDETEKQEPDEGLESSGPYRLEDDLSIFRAINSFYGNTFCGTVPWSFWQTYRKITGSNRSTSSLYHHWNGSIQKKYGGYLRQKRLRDCIQWIEQEISHNREVLKRKPDRQQLLTPTGMPLMHNRSLPVGPILPVMPGTNSGQPPEISVFRPQSYVFEY